MSRPPAIQATELMLTMEPPPAVRICGSTAWAAKNTCRKFTAIIQSNASPSTSAKLWR